MLFYFSRQMAISWKLILDILLIISIIGTVCFLAFMKQKEIHLYTNLALFSILCFLYWLYISSIRKKDLMRWLEENKSSDRPCVKSYKRKLKDLISAPLPYWSWIYLNLAVACIFLVYFPTIVVITFFYSAASQEVCQYLGIIYVFYFLIIKKYISDFKMRYRAKYHTGSLLLFIGTFLLFNNFGILAILTGDIITVLGLAFHYDIYKRYFHGVKLRFDIRQQVQPACNGDAADAPQTRLKFFERFRRYVWRLIVMTISFCHYL